MDIKNPEGSQNMKGDGADNISEKKKKGKANVLPRDRKENFWQLGSRMASAGEEEKTTKPIR